MSYQIDCFLIFFIVIQLTVTDRYKLAADIFEFTLNRRPNAIYRDCFYIRNTYLGRITSNTDDIDDYVRLCIRIPYDEKSTECSLFTKQKISFEKLYKENKNEYWLMDLNIPLDLIDAYQQYIFYRKNQTEILINNKQLFICICKSEEIFGRYCEYKVLRIISNEEFIDVGDIIVPSIGKARKEFSPENRLISCYNLLATCRDSLNRKRCLDWRDICDGEIDCINGDDENQCMNFEMNKCDIEIEFRCRNGLCIPPEFLFDGQFDCLDGSDEQLKLNEQLCYQFPWIDCEEHLCTKDQFSCGDGQCISWFARFQVSIKCMNWNDMFYMCEQKVLRKTLNDGYCQWKDVPNTNSECIDVIRHYIASRTQDLSDLVTIQNDISNKCKTMNQSLLFYAYSYFFSPFVNAYISSEQINNGSLHPDLFCFKNQCVTNENLSKYHSIPFDNLFQIKLEKDTCREHPHDFYQCLNSIECISKYRLLDGYKDCLDGSDENIEIEDERFLQDRYQCKTVSEKIMFHLIGNEQVDCSDGSDEIYQQIDWKSIKCEQTNDIGCQLLREANDMNLINKELRIKFSDLCDSQWDLAYGIDEMNCSISGWKCLSNWFQYDRKDSLLWNGNCIPPRSNCNHIWDFVDGRDEIFCLNSKAFRWICQNITTWKFIDVKLRPDLIGNGIIDCLGGQDERNTIACEDEYQIGQRFRCSNGTCIDQQLLCDGIEHCLNGEDESNGYCRHQDNLFTERICPRGTFDCSLSRKPNVTEYLQCLNRNARCDGKPECLPRNLNPDEQRCHSQRNIRNKFVKYTNKENPTTPRPQQEPQFSSSAPNLVWFCNRGIAIENYYTLGSMRIACLCPSSSYGDRCQYQSHRITVIYTIEMTLDPSKHNFSNIRVITLLQYQYKTIDHMKLSFNWIELPLKRKQRFYLHYPWSLLDTIHQASSNDYTIMFHIYTIGRNLVKLFSIHRYPIKYPFLPTYRLTVILNPTSSKSCSNSMINSCGIHSQNCHLIDTASFYCECQSGWYGLECTEQYQNVSCASNSYFLPTFYNGIDQYDDFLCICPINRYGHTCHMVDEGALYSNRCGKNGTLYLITADRYYDEKAEAFCFCQKTFFGDNCEIHGSSLQISVRSTSLAMTLQISSLSIDSHTLTISHQYQVNMFNSTISSPYFYSNERYYRVGLLKVFTSSVNYNIYLLWTRNAPLYSKEIFTLNETNRCRHAREFQNLVPEDKNDYNSDIKLIPFMKRYHQACQNSNILCFYDEQTYLCLCDLQRQSASCYKYDFQYDQCHFCLNDGLCVYRNKHENRYDYLCRCSKCYYGLLCQYKTAQFGYSLETLLISNDQIDDYENISSISKIIYFILSIFMFFIGLLSNLCSILTLLHSTIIRTFLSYNTNYLYLYE
ncbi:hypothetical protein I4U23_005160 [Adineta vaga]|nr:hypothetical protein I4U23_005160 [Adineta vaga]